MADAGGMYLKESIHELSILCLIPWIQEVVYLYMLIVVICLIVSVCRDNLAIKCHWILRKLMEIAAFIYLYFVRNKLFFGTIRLLGLLAGACIMQATECGCENYSPTFIFIVNKAWRRYKINITDENGWRSTEKMDLPHHNEAQIL